MNVFSAVRPLHESWQIDVSTVRPPAILVSHVSLVAVSLESVFTTVAVMTRELPVTCVTWRTCQHIGEPLQACSYTLPRLELKCINESPQGLTINVGTGNNTAEVQIYPLSCGTVQLGHPVSGSHKWGDLFLQFGGWARGKEQEIKARQRAVAP